MMMNKIASILLPTAYFPSIQYFMLLAAANEVFIEVHETYPKQTYRNRCEIYSANGKLALTVPVIKPQGNHSKTKDIAISDHQNWQIIHWRAIESAYAKSPYFMYYCDDLKPFFELPAKNLVHYNMLLLNFVLDLIGLKTKINFTESYEKSPAGLFDYREIMTPKKPFTLFPLKPYYQVFQSRYGFLPGLSILDLLFNEGSGTRDFILQGSL
jgi:hypothetical protein